MRFLRVVAVLLFAVATMAQTRVVRQTSGTIAFNAPNAINSMDASNTVYSSIRIANGTIAALSQQPVENAISLPAGAAIYPGFIDSHSHAITFFAAQATDQGGNPYWISLANVNSMLLPDCATPAPGSVTCFTPVTTQDTVVSLLKNARPNAAGWILGWNYEPSRLTCSAGGVTKYGFQCPNFENQNAGTVLAALDTIQPDTPVLITSESGHIAYVNSAALKVLNICNVSPGATASCYTPFLNPTVETSLAKTGQLNEDLAIYALTVVEELLAGNYSGGSDLKKLEFLGRMIRASLTRYSQLGYTTVQEGAATPGLVSAYMAVASTMALEGQHLPVTMAFLVYSQTPPAGFATTVASARALQLLMTAGGYDMFIGGMKAIADGSNQGYTGDMLPGQYQNLNKPFTDPGIFPQPYHGLPDYDVSGLTMAAQAAHKGNLPLWVHTNGSEAQSNVLGVLGQAASPPLRDVVVHFTVPTQAQMNAIAKNNLGGTFLVNDYYYYYQPLCEQVLGPAGTQNLYPAQWAQQSGIRYGLHADTSVTPPSPLFAVWVASTRAWQAAPWLPPLSAACRPGTNNQKVSRLQALRAFTSNAAWLYGRDTTSGLRPGIGSLQKGFAGDLVVLSADPLDPDTDLSKVFVLYTVHNGNIVYPSSGSGPAASGPVWPK